MGRAGETRQEDPEILGISTEKILGSLRRNHGEENVDYIATVFS